MAANSRGRRAQYAAMKAKTWPFDSTRSRELSSSSYWSMRRVHIVVFRRRAEAPPTRRDPVEPDAKKSQTAPALGLALAAARALWRIRDHAPPDAAPANWVDRHAPPALRPWLKLGRFDRPTGIWLLMLPGWQGIALAAAARGDWPSRALLLCSPSAPALMRAAGCAFNDIVDRDIDARGAASAGRPASGQVSVPRIGVLVVCGGLSLAILFALNILTLFLGVASLALVAAYPFMKRITWWPQAWLGLTFNWGALLGFAAAQGGPWSATAHRPCGATASSTCSTPSWGAGCSLDLTLGLRHHLRGPGPGGRRPGRGEVLGAAPGPGQGPAASRRRSAIGLPSPYIVCERRGVHSALACGGAPAAALSRPP